MIEYRQSDLPLITIIIPVFNRYDLIKIALDSVVNQTYVQWECLVIDDGSTDATLDALISYKEKDPRIDYFIRERLPKGAPTCRNIGLENAKGDYIIFLDSDDFLLPFCIEQRVEVIKQNPDCDFLVFPMGIKKGEVVKKKDMSTNSSYLVEFLSANAIWQTMCPIWKKAFIQKLNGFTEGYPRFNDPELMIRALLQENVKFQVYNTFDYDCVFVPSPKNNQQFSAKTFVSLMLFIPNLSVELENTNKSHYRVYLGLYLHLWFKYFYVPLDSPKIKQSMYLIMMFYKQGIFNLTKTINLMMRLFLYSSTKLCCKKPINKLTLKSFYN